MAGRNGYAGYPLDGDLHCEPRLHGYQGDDDPGIGPNGAPLTVHFFITAGNGFSELRFIATDATTVISGTARRR
jgi:hypothetical protein